MKILWFTWKDRKHPEAGGAEFINEGLAQKLVEDGHEVILLVGGFKGGRREEVINGYKVIRVGNRYTAYLMAALYYLRNLQGWPDLIIEEINTIPFMTQWYAKEKRVLLIYQLCREIWFYQFWFPLNIVGYLLEPIYLWLLRNNNVLTESKSTKNDLLNYGFHEKNIDIFPIFIDIEPLKSIDEKKTYDRFTVLSLGAIRSMKRTLDQIQAFELAKEEIPELQMKIAGKPVGRYGRKVLEYIQNSKFKDDIEYLGSVSREKKIELMRKSHVLLVTSVKEGWGLVVTEAASQGTPAIVYDVDGLRDSVFDDQLITTGSTQIIADKIIMLTLDIKTAQKTSEHALQNSKNFQLSSTYNSFTAYIIAT